MSIRWVKRNEIDEAKWNACVASRPETASVCAKLWYLDACCEHWDALVEDDYRAVMPLFRRKKFGIPYLYPPFFVAQLGVLGLPLRPMEKWLHAIPGRFLRADLLFNACNDLSFVPERHRITHHTCLLPLNRPYADLRQAYSHNHCRNLKKAESAGLRILRDADTESVIRLFRNTRGRQQNVGYAAGDYRRLENLIRCLRERKALEVWSVETPDGQLCAAAFFPTDGHRHTFLFSGRNAESDTNRAMFFLMDQFIQAHAGENALLDFNGSNNEAVAKFYLGFGAQKQAFAQVRLRW
ncbi:MAG: GNAT family N-acetyltransferase [Bacteroidales bacterium]|nr:GNAT family N-acetyltransferase [Bacteroidales bacterium]